MEGSREAPAQNPAHGGDVLPRGVHHLALTTEDMGATTTFYVDVLGMPLVHAMKVPPGLGTGPGNRGNPPYEEIRHYFYDMGNDSLLAFFELPKDAEPQSNRNAIGGMQHVAFTVSVERFDEIERRLDENGIKHSGRIPQLPGLLGIYFFDPNGIRLEMACQPDDGAAPNVLDLITQTKSQARAELETLDGVDAAWIDRMVAGLPDG
ncbi:MAG: VOC family protein [Alphaproteobacteria bacterium]|nr:VOC family protein [Alphaproteobacteria bacterium]